MSLPLKLDLSQLMVVMDTLRQFLHGLQVVLLNLNPLLQQGHEPLQMAAPYQVNNVHTATYRCSKARLSHCESKHRKVCFFYTY